MHCKMYEASSNASPHFILALWDSNRPRCRPFRPIIAHTGCPDKAYSARGVFSGPLLLLSLLVQSMRGVAPEIQVNLGLQMQGKRRDYRLCEGAQGFGGPK